MLYVFTTTTCSKCIEIEEFLQETAINYTSMVIDEDKIAENKAKELNIISVPVIMLEQSNGEFKKISFYDLKRLYKNNQL